MIIKTKSPKGNHPNYVSTTIGDLYIFGLSAGDQQEIDEFFEKGPKEVSPEDSIRELVKYVCFPLKDLGEKKTKPDSISLTNIDVAELTNSDLENICKCFIDNNEYLYAERLTETSENEEGKTVHFIKSGDINI